MVKVELNLAKVAPGDTVYFDFEIVENGSTPEATVVSQIKEQVWSHPKLDYQSSKLTPGLFNQETQREVSFLRIWATVRKTDKATRSAVKEIPVADIDAYMASTVAVFGELVADFWTFVDGYPTVGDMVAAGKSVGTASLVSVPVLVLVVLAYFLLKG